MANTRRNFPEVTRHEFRAIDSIYDAVMAVNAADSESDSQLPWSPRHDGRSDPMTLLGDAARSGLRILGFTRGEARVIWAEMLDNGSGAEWNVNLLRTGVIGTHNRYGRL